MRSEATQAMAHVQAIDVIFQDLTHQKYSYLKNKKVDVFGTQYSSRSIE